MTDPVDYGNTPPAPAAAPPSVPPTLPGVPPVWPAQTAPPMPRDGKRPAIALVLSVLFPGLGQVYNGQPAKAFVFFFAWVACFYVVVQGDPIPWVFGMAFAYLYGLVDAWRSAELVNLRQRGARESGEEEEAGESPAWGLTLVVLGLLLLLNNVGWLRLAEAERFWPLLLVAAGALFIRESLRRRRAKESGGETDTRA